MSKPAGLRVDRSEGGWGRGWVGSSLRGSLQSCTAMHGAGGKGLTWAWKKAGRFWGVSSRPLLQEKGALHRPGQPLLTSLLGQSHWKEGSSFARSPITSPCECVLPPTPTAWCGACPQLQRAPQLAAQQVTPTVTLGQQVRTPASKTGERGGPWRFRLSNTAPHLILLQPPLQSAPGLCTWLWEVSLYLTHSDGSLAVKQEA